MPSSLPNSRMSFQQLSPLSPTSSTFPSPWILLNSTQTCSNTANSSLVGATLPFIYTFLSLFPFIAKFLQRVNTLTVSSSSYLALIEIQSVQCSPPPLQSRALVTSTLLNPMVNPQASNFMVYQQHLPKVITLSFINSRSPLLLVFFLIHCSLLLFLGFICWILIISPDSPKLHPWTSSLFIFAPSVISPNLLA